MPGQRVIDRSRVRLTQARVASFWRRVDMPAPGACWQWFGGRQASGYGTVSFGTNPSGTWPTHRLAYELAIGPIPSGFDVHHRCNNPACVNPSHLEALSTADHGAQRRGPRKSRKNTWMVLPALVITTVDADRFAQRYVSSDTTGCFIWTGAVERDGYGSFRTQSGRTTLAHRFAFEMTHGPVPDHFVVDHLCRNRRCVNPSHLEAVSARDNVLRGNGYAANNARKTHCVNGHPFDEANTTWTNEGHRRCRACTRWHGRRKASA